MTGTERISECELAEAIAIIRRDYRNAADPAEAAADIFRVALGRREPEWQHRDAVVDAKGDIWVWSSRGMGDGGSGGWEAPGISGRVGAAIPARPLRRLVPDPEASP
jgi:hypothetical protein